MVNVTQSHYSPRVSRKLCFP